MAKIITIGGAGFNWRGKNIRNVIKDKVSCVSMPRSDSVVSVPCFVETNKKYQISISASKSAGNGRVLVNFFGGKNDYGASATINVISASMKKYIISLSAPNIPNSVPTYIKIFRPDVSVGCVFIGLVEVEEIEQNKESREQQDRKEEMIFRPYAVEENEEEKIGTLNKIEAMPKVSIITPTRNNVEELKKCCVALIANTVYPNWEWIIGDSGSSDGTEEYIKSLKDGRIRFIKRNTTEGSFSSINNELSKFAVGELLLFLNDDTEPQMFWLYEMVSKICRDINIGIVGARLEHSRGVIQHAGIAFIPEGPANIGRAVLKSFPPKFANYDRYFQAVTGACLLIRKKDFNDIGGFDPIYYFCYEDVDLCLTVKKQLNKKVLYAANALVFHSESVSQKKYSTSGERQKEGIKVFKERWAGKIEKDFVKFQKDISKGLRKIDISFVTCVNNKQQYISYVVNSLFKSDTTKQYEMIPIFNFNNDYSASQALNIGRDKAKGDIIVFCHQDVRFFDRWITLLYDRVSQIEKTDKLWGVLGTAGINQKDDTTGVVYNGKRKMQWSATVRAAVSKTQTLDEHCLIIRKNSNLRFDEQTFDGFHFYGCDLALDALSRGLNNYGILCPLVHEGSGSLGSGREEFMRLLNALAQKWKKKFNHIRTTTSVIIKGQAQTFIRFRD